MGFWQLERQHHLDLVSSAVLALLRTRITAASHLLTSPPPRIGCCTPYTNCKAVRILRHQPLTLAASKARFPAMMHSLRKRQIYFVRSSRVPKVASPKLASTQSFSRVC